MEVAFRGPVRRHRQDEESGRSRDPPLTPTAQLIRHIRTAGSAGLALGGALGVLETSLNWAGSPLRRVDLVDALLGVLTYALAFGIAATLCGALTGGLLLILRRQPSPAQLWRGYTAAALLCFALAGALLGVVTYAPAPPRPAAVLAIGAWTGLALAALALRLRLPRRRLVPGFARRRRTFLLMGGLLAAELVASRFRLGASPRSRAASAPRQAGGAAPPNVLLITVDTLRADAIGALGGGATHTPFLDALAAGGVVSRRAITPQHQTNAAHASLLTGAAPNTTGVRVHMVDRLREDLPTLASVLGESGYTTAGIYSWVSLDPAFSGLNRGFDFYEGYVINRPAALGNPLLEQAAAAFRRLKESFQVVKTSDLLLKASDALEESMDGRADVTTDAILQWLDQKRSGPFFLWAHYFDPHYGYTPPSPFDNQHDPDYIGSLNGSVATVEAIQSGALRLDPNSADNQHLKALYQGEVSFTDQQLARLFDGLKERGLSDGLLVALTGDHGEGFGEHQHWFHPSSVYNTEIAVPLVLHYPGRLAAKELSAPISLIDVMPTLLDLLGLEIPSSVEGKSLLPLIEGRSDGSDRIVFSQSFDDGLLAAVGPEWKLVANMVTGQTQLYRLSTDPGEEVDLAGQAPEAWSTLAAALMAWMESQQIRTRRPLLAPE